MSHYLITINGVGRDVSAHAKTPLVEVLRNQLGLVGTRLGCGLEQCGSCRVLIDGKPCYACTTTLEDATHCKIETVESDDPLLANLKASFLALNAGQCGYCLSGILMAALAHLRETTQPSRESVQAALRDNLCRCGAHNRIINAILAAASQ